MHELSICRAISGIVTDGADGRHVSRVAVRIGHLRQVVPSTLEYCWGIVTADTDLEGCELAIEHVPAIAHCTQCHATATLTRPVLVCEACGERGMVLESGEEFLVESIDVLEVT